MTLGQFKDENDKMQSFIAPNICESSRKTILTRADDESDCIPCQNLLQDWPPRKHCFHTLPKVPGSLQLETIYGEMQNFISRK